MSNAPRPARWNSRSRSCAGHERAFGQRRSTSPAFCWASAVPHSGQCVGMTNSRSVPSRSVHHRAEHLGDDVARLADDHPVADQHALAAHLVGVVQGGQRHRRARRPHRLHERERRDAAGAPDVHPDVEELRGGLLRRVLVRDRPARRARRGAEPALQRHLVDLDHHAVDLVLDVVAVLAPVRDVRRSPRRRRAGPRVRSRDRQPPRRAARRRPRTGAPGRTPPACRGRGRSAAGAATR